MKVYICLTLIFPSFNYKQKSLTYIWMFENISTAINKTWTSRSNAIYCVSINFFMTWKSTSEKIFHFINLCWVAKPWILCIFQFSESDLMNFLSVFCSIRGQAGELRWSNWIEAFKQLDINSDSRENSFQHFWN